MADKIVTCLWDLFSDYNRLSTPSADILVTLPHTVSIAFGKKGQDLHCSSHIIYNPFLKRFCVPTANPETIESFCHPLRTSLI